MKNETKSIVYYSDNTTISDSDDLFESYTYIVSSFDTTLVSVSYDGTFSKALN